MQIQVNTDDHIAGRVELARRVEAEVDDALSRFSDQITRVEVHLSDENSEAKSGGGDKRCLIEARLAGRPPLAVSHEAATIDEAFGGACDKLKRSLESLSGKLKDKHGRATIRGEPGDA
ncbi:MAG: HPF/RaiA family ribosome-associated protein [Burkholderiales bacterium]